MGSAAAPTLNRLRQSLAGIDPSLTPALPGCGREVALDPAIDAALGGGLSCGALHEFAPAGPGYLGTASGFAFALASIASGAKREVLWIGTEYAVPKAVDLTAPASTCSAWPPRNSSYCACRSRSTCSGRWKRRCGAARLSCVIAELTGEGRWPISPRRDAFHLRRAKVAAPAPPVSVCSFVTMPPQRSRVRQRPAGRSRRRPVSLMPMAGSAVCALTFRFARTGVDLPAVGSSSGIIMNMSSSRRYLSVWLRRLSTDRIERRSSKPVETFVVVESVQSAQRITALTDGAVRLGLKAGMGLADARAMYPKLPVVEADPEADQRLLETSPTGATATRRWWSRSAGWLASRRHRLRPPVRRRGGADARPDLAGSRSRVLRPASRWPTPRGAHGASRAMACRASSGR